MARTLPPYILPEELTAALPAQWWTEATDDAGTGDGSVIAAAVCDDASDWVDSYLQGRYPLPIGDAGAFAKLREAAKVRSLWTAFQRRGRHGENNPWEEELKRWITKLEGIERGSVPLLTEAAGSAAPVPPAKIGVSTRPLRTASRVSGVTPI